MGRDTEAREPVSARGFANVRGGSRGRGWGDILSDCSYSRASARGCDGGRVQVFIGVLDCFIIARIVFLVYYH